ncbi:hypothetical protein DFJ77DRAFT_26622 [Powellomyces hirtus]|nr:hypothetical protein DFJ77DRAFT_26622 [Powellomyces hirtus]
MPSTRSALFALAATGCIASSANAFWLIPGSHHTDNRAAQLAADQTATQRFRSVIAEKYNAVADAAANIVPGSATPAAKPTTHSVYDDLIRALEEVTTDVGYSASLAKGTLVKGIYVRQDDDAYLLAMDVPGLHTREVEVTAEKGTLKIHGERKCPTVVATGKPDPLCIPRVYDATFTFPSDANEEKADAKLDAGVVKVFPPLPLPRPASPSRLLPRPPPQPKPPALSRNTSSPSRSASTPLELPKATSTSTRRSCK